MSRWLKLDEELFDENTAVQADSIRIEEKNGEAYLTITLKLKSNPVPPDSSVPNDQKEENKLLYRETVQDEIFKTKKASIMVHRAGTNPKGRASRLVITASISPKVPHTGGSLIGDGVKSLEFSE
jgi:hypothetical protein